ncbi:MAG: YccF domain-containing protein [Rikenellaceae bacterium]
MNLLGNIIWLIFGGLLTAIEYFIAGITLCCTIIGIPFGIQVFKLGMLALAPFGRTTVQTEKAGGCLAIIMNVIWIFFGISIAITHVITGLLLFITIIGIPFGKQHFKLAAVALTPFGREIISE